MSLDDSGAAARRVERVEVVDATGTVRAVLGVLGVTHEDGEIHGLQLRDAMGAIRLELAVHDVAGPRLTFISEGNEVLIIGTADARGDIAMPGPFVSLVHDDVDRSLLWRLDARGLTSG